MLVEERTEKMSPETVWKFAYGTSRPQLKTVLELLLATGLIEEFDQIVAERIQFFEEDEEAPEPVSAELIHFPPQDVRKAA